MDGLEISLDAVAGAIVGVYVVRVGIAGNGKQLLILLKEDDKYLDLLVAIYAIYLLQEFGPTHAIVDQLLWAAGLAILIKMVSSNVNFLSALEDFGSGKRGLLDTVKLILGV